MPSTTGPIIVVALIGFGRPIEPRYRKLFRHNGFIAFEIGRRTEALRWLQSQTPVGALVIDGRSIPDSDDPEPSFVALISSAAAETPDRRPVRAIVSSNGRLEHDARPHRLASACAAAAVSGLTAALGCLAFGLGIAIGAALAVSLGVTVFASLSRRVSA